jgi:kynurenine formamidase
MSEENVEMGGELIDLSHEVAHGTVTYPGLPAPEITDHLSRERAERVYAPGVTFQIGRICMIANTGTYVDAPFHRFADGADLAGLELDALAGQPGLVVDPPAGTGRSIGPEAFSELVLTDRAVLIRTGWDRHWDTPAYGEGHPFLTREAAELLVGAGPAIVGIDSLNVDDDDDSQRPVHTLLLGVGIPIVEHLCNLAALPQEGFRFHAAPVKVRGMGTFPVRAYAELDS